SPTSASTSPPPTSSGANLGAAPSKQRCAQRSPTPVRVLEQKSSRSTSADPTSTASDPSVNSGPSPKSPSNLMPRRRSNSSSPNETSPCGTTPHTAGATNPVPPPSPSAPHHEICTMRRSSPCPGNADLQPSTLAAPSVNGTIIPLVTRSSSKL